MDDDTNWSHSWSALNYVLRLRNINFKQEIFFHRNLDVFKLVACQYVKSISYILTNVVQDIHLKVFFKDFDVTALLKEFESEILSANSHNEVYIALDYFRSQICVDLDRSEYSIAEILDTEVDNRLVDYYNNRNGGI